MRCVCGVAASLLAVGPRRCSRWFRDDNEPPEATDIHGWTLGRGRGRWTGSQADRFAASSTLGKARSRALACRGAASATCCRGPERWADTRHAAQGVARRGGSPDAPQRRSRRLTSHSPIERPPGRTLYRVFTKWRWVASIRPDRLCQLSGQSAVTAPDGADRRVSSEEAGTGAWHASSTPSRRPTRRPGPTTRAWSCARSTTSARSRAPTSPASPA